MTELRKEEKADERRSLPTTARPKVKVIEECHICGNEIEPDDLAVCGGCDKPTCSECMGDDGICRECEAEEPE
jgi:hypothetical protein